MKKQAILLTLNAKLLYNDDEIKKISGVLSL